ncbi:MAG TPA: hypothetical protein VE174_06995 [Actinomycetota bacterium]|nr:hypothetical protein [Actinomycetota bacterium]
MRRSLTVLLVLGLVAGSLAMPAEAAKKKKKKKKPVVAVAPVCPGFVPGEAGAGKPTIKLTDAATEAAPVVQKVTLAESAADLTQGFTAAGTDAFNIQVDSAATTVGVYALIEFEPRNDIDLNLLHPDGSYAARSRSWNTIQESTDQGPFPISSQGYGGEGTDHSEKLVGIGTNDCGGWTLTVENYLGMGGEYEVKLWVGEMKNAPQAPGEDPAE